MTDTRTFGTLPDGREVTAYQLGEPEGLSVTVLDRGATIHRLQVPSRGRPGGDPVNLALGFATLEGYLASDAYVGAVVGRYANRIAHGSFGLDGTTYRLAANEGANCLHGGIEGFDARIWEVVGSPSADRLVLRLVSADGDQGFPGRLEVLAAYHVGDGALTLDLQARTDAPTVVSLTSHVYLNLGGEGSGSVDGHLLAVDADAYLPVDAEGIPLMPDGALSSVDDTPFDLRKPARVGDRVRSRHEQIGAAGGIDHSFHLSGSGFRRAVRLDDPASGRGLELWTDQVAVQVYTGNSLDGSTIGTSGRRYRCGDGIALETQHHPDAPNRAALPSPVLRPGQVYAARTRWRLRW